MPGIFICYRRSDSGYVKGIDDALRKHFVSTPIFRDIDSIAPGLDFLEQIDKEVGSCDVLLAVIGANWLTVTNEQGRPRLMESKDFVRHEIQRALERNIRVIPVLVGGARMPSVSDLPSEVGALARRNAIELSDTRWDYDVDRLLSSLNDIPALRANVPVEAIGRTGDVAAPQSGVQPGSIRGRLPGITVGLAIAAALMLFLVVGGLTTLIAWRLGWWFSNRIDSASVSAMLIYNSIMLYVPGTLIASAML